jgi:hypothetical protein
VIFLAGEGAALNYTYGPVYRYRGPRSIDEIYRMGEPVVVVARAIPLHELRRIETTRVRGFVFAEGDLTDEPLVSFLMNERRAAVLGVRGILERAVEGTWVIVDGVNSVVVIDPTPEALLAFETERRSGPPKGVAEKSAIVARRVAASLRSRRDAERGRPAVGDAAGGGAASRETGGAPGLVERLLAGLLESGRGDGHGHGHGHG